LISLNWLIDWLGGLDPLKTMRNHLRLGRLGHTENAVNSNAAQTIRVVEKTAIAAGPAPNNFMNDDLAEHRRLHQFDG